MAIKNYYVALGIDPAASLRDIKKAYVPLALKHHPDLAPEGERESARKSYREIQTAYWILSDRRLREQYDRRLMGKGAKGRGAELADWTMAAAKTTPSERAELDRRFAEAEVAFARGDHWEAAGILDKLVTKLPGEAGWQRLYAQATSRCGAWERARAACEAAILAAPEAAENHYILAEVLAEQGDFRRAGRACRHALELAPDYEPAKKLLEKVSTLRVVLFRQKATLPLYVVSVLALAALVIVLVEAWRRG